MDIKSLVPLLLSLLAGMCTVIGAFIVFFSKSKNKKLICFSLGFSAGVMITISFTDLYITAEENLSKKAGMIGGVLYTLLFLVMGALMALLIDEFIPDVANDNKVYDSKNVKLYRVGYVSMIALMIHNFPEGVATFVSGYENVALGISIALAIALHNIPEGISVAMPIYYSTGSRKEAFEYTFISGIAEPVGAILAWLILKPFINDTILGVIFALVAGIMLYISFAELIPTAREYHYNKIYLFSIFLGICIMPVSHIFIK